MELRGARFGLAFIIFAVAAGAPMPSIGPFHRPTPRHLVKAFALVTRHLQIDFMRVLKVSYPLRQPLRLIVAIDPNLHNCPAPSTKYCVQRTSKPTRSSMFAAVTTTVSSYPGVSTNNR